MADSSKSKSEEIKDRALFDGIAAQYAKKDLTPSCIAARKAQLLEALSLCFPPNEKIPTVVEIACGIGAPAFYLRGRFNNYIGIDQSSEMIEIARKFSGSDPHIQFRTENIKSTALTHHSADLILAVGALHHMTEWDAVMESLKRIAKPGSYFVLIEPQSGNPIFQMLRWLRKKIDKAYSADQYYFTRAELSHLLQRHGLEAIQYKYEGFFSTIFGQVILSPQFIMAPLSRCAVQLDRWLEAHLPSMFLRLSWNIIFAARFPK
jgi:SAM-dependent methyltransferase